MSGSAIALLVLVGALVVADVALVAVIARLVGPGEPPRAEGLASPTLAAPDPLVKEPRP